MNGSHVCTALGEKTKPCDQCRLAQFVHLGLAFGRHIRKASYSAKYAVRTREGFMRSLLIPNRTGLHFSLRIRPRFLPVARLKWYQRLLCSPSDK